MVSFSQQKETYKPFDITNYAKRPVVVNIQTPKVIKDSQVKLWNTKRLLKI